MRKNLKKGFTIVELVIVIAVIGILSAVLIPTFTNLVAKANLAADKSLVQNINTQLSAAEVTDGKNVTMYDALQDAKEAGYLVENINARSNNELVWDSTIDRFSLLDKDGNVIVGETQSLTDKMKLWKIYNTIPAVADQTYSIYATNKVSGVANVAVSFDAGENTKITKVSYANAGSAQNVVIRTNGSDLDINAPLDTVHHYGSVKAVSIAKISNSSYYEFGQAKFVEVANGRLVISNAEGAKVESLYLSATNGQYDNIILATMAGAELPAVIQREEVEAPQAGAKKLVITVQQVTNAGVEKEDETEKLYLDSTGADISAYEGDTKVNSDSVSPVGQMMLENGAADSKVAPKAAAKTGATLFAGGLGTEANPYKVADSKQLNNAVKQSSAKYYELVADVTMDADYVVPNRTYLKLDGKNHSIYTGEFNEKVNGSKAALFGEYGYGCEFKNLTLHRNNTHALVYVAYSGINFENVTLGGLSDISNVFVHNENNEGGFVGIVGTNAMFENCTNYYSYYSKTSGVAFGLFVAGYHNQAAGTITFKDCVNYGNVTAAHAGLLMGNDQSSSYFDIVIDGFTNYGTLVGYQTAGIVARGTSKAKFYSNDELIDSIVGLRANTYILQADASLALTQNGSGNLVITKATKAGAAKYVVTYLAYAHYEKTNGEQGTLQTIVTYEFEPEFGNGNTFETELKKYKMMDYATYLQHYLAPQNVEWTDSVSNANGAEYFVDTTNNVIVVRGKADYTLTINANIVPTLSVLDSTGEVIAVPVNLA